MTRVSGSPWVRGKGLESELKRWFRDRDPLSPLSRLHLLLFALIYSDPEQRRKASNTSFPQVYQIPAFFLPTPRQPTKCS